MGKSCVTYLLTYYHWQCHYCHNTYLSSSPDCNRFPLELFMCPPFWMQYIPDDNPTCRTNISHVLVDNDCDIDPDYIDFNCSIAYRGNVAPDLQLQMSSIGVLDNVTVQTWQQFTTTYMSVVWTSKASWRVRDGQFRCKVTNTMIGIQPSCSSARVSVMCEYEFAN